MQTFKSFHLQTLKTEFFAYLVSSDSNEGVFSLFKIIFKFNSLSICKNSVLVLEKTKFSRESSITDNGTENLV